jgi:holo-[acyl-carrier protein] synthase
MIHGIGVDIIEIARVEKAVKRWKDRFLNKIFTEAEIKYSSKHIFWFQHLAARFAAKEAVLKALGIKWLRLKDICIENDQNGKPQVRLEGNLKRLCDELKIDKIYLTLTHSKDYAVAYVICLKK